MFGTLFHNLLERLRPFSSNAIDSRSALSVKFFKCCSILGKSGRDSVATEEEEVVEDESEKRQPEKQLNSDNADSNKDTPMDDDKIENTPAEVIA